MSYPGYGEWVGFPRVDTSETDIGVGAWVDRDMLWEVEGDSDSFSWHGFDSSSSPSFLLGVVGIN